MAVTFTPDQQATIDARGSSILVSAAAGSGKTAVLVERIIQMVSDGEHPVDIDRLLVVTFTNAAAAQMRERITQALSARVDDNPGNAHLLKQLTLIHNAQITTIDSFCLYIIRNHFDEIDLDPDFRVADDGEIKLLMQDVLAQMLEDYFTEGREDFLACVEYFAPTGKEKRLEEQILGLYEFAMIHGRENGWNFTKRIMRFLRKTWRNAGGWDCWKTMSAPCSRKRGTAWIRRGCSVKKRTVRICIWIHWRRIKIP